MTVHSKNAARRALASLAATLVPPLVLTSMLALMLSGCGTLRTHYPAVSAQHEMRQAADAAGHAPVDAALTHGRLIEQMQREGLWYASLAHIDAFEQTVGTTPAVLRLRADALRRTGQPAASRAAYEQLARNSDPVAAAAGLHGLGLLAGAEGDYDRASEWLERGRSKRPTDADLLGDLGYALLRAGRIEAARVPLMQAAEMKPGDARMQLNVAAWLLASGQDGRAEQMLAATAAGELARDAVRTTARQARDAAQALSAAEMAPTRTPVPAGRAG